MTQTELSLPPFFNAMGFAADADLPNEVFHRAKRGRIDPGTICFSERPDRLDAILVLGPETPLRHALQVIYPLMLATNDALGACIPAGVALHLGWPDRILVNGALAGGLALYSETEDLDAVPQWMLARITIDVMGNPQDPFPGAQTQRTSLYEEGAGETSAPQVLEAFCRYFMNWLDRWQRGGIPALSQNWLERAAGREEEAAFPQGSKLVRGTIAEVAETGDLHLATAEGEVSLALPELLSGQTWEI